MAQRDRAPGRLELLQAFVNSLEVDTGTDELADGAAAARWLVDAGLLDAGARAGEADAAEVRALREGLRELLRANNGAPLPETILNDLNRQAAGLKLTVAFAGTSTSTMVPAAPGVKGAMAALVAIAHSAMADGSWDRLKACREDTCKWVYYDQSRNRSSAWCSMAVCGNRAKARAFRARSKSSS